MTQSKRWTPNVGRFLTQYNKLDLYFWEGDGYAATVTVDQKGKMGWLICDGEEEYVNVDPEFIKPHLEARRLAKNNGWLACE